jgi:hypothetical protein
MSPFTPSAFRAAALISLAICAASVAGAATIPFSNSFDSSGFTATAGLTLNTTAGTVTTTASGNVIPVTYGSEQFTNAANTSYTVSTQFVATSLGTNNGDQAVGVVLFGFDGTFTGTSDGTRYLLASWVFQGSTLGALRFTEIDGSNLTLGTTQTVDTNGGTGGVYSANTTLTLKVTVTHTAANTYDLSLGLFDASGTSQFGSSNSFSYTAADAPSGGYYMGVRNRVPNLSGTTTLVNNDFVVSAIPEPSTYAALAGLGAFGLAAFRRRRA